MREVATQLSVVCEGDHDAQTTLGETDRGRGMRALSCRKWGCVSKGRGRRGTDASDGKESNDSANEWDARDGLRPARVRVASR